MPELAEVAYFSKQWQAGVGQPVLQVEVHPKARVFRGMDTTSLVDSLTGAKLVSFATHGKQMLFRFNRATLGVHLGMTGVMKTEKPDYEAGKHDHLVLRQKKQTLVFRDPRLFGRILFTEGKQDPDWWTKLPPDLLSKEFSKKALQTFLSRRKGAPLKAILLMQERFPGVGNWMADEILWRAELHPAMPGGKLTPEQTGRLWKEIRYVCREAMRIIGTRFDDPPDSWLFLHRWKKSQTCPRCGVELKQKEIGGRTTCWCPRCQA